MSLKRKAAEADASSVEAKRTKDETDASYINEGLGESKYRDWPAPHPSIEAARTFIRDAARSAKPTLLVPDRDCDGLSSGHILRQTLLSLGKPKEKIATHFVGKGRNIHAKDERELLESRVVDGEKPDTIIVLDQGSNDIRDIAVGVPTLIIDHHYSKTFPQNAVICSACESPPIATASLLTFVVCEGILLEADLLSPDVHHKLAWLALIGIYGDLGPNIPLDRNPYPSILSEVNPTYKTSITKLVSFLNAPRRTPSADPGDSWELLRIASDTTPSIDPKRIIALTSDATPMDSTLVNLRKILLNLDRARIATSTETERCSHTPPAFSEDGRLAILTIDSPYQIHPLIATRWAGHLKSKKLVAVGCANTGYLPGKVNFSCRLAKTSIKARNEALERKTGRKRDNPDDMYLKAEEAAGKFDSESDTDEEGKDENNIISLLRGYAAEDNIFAARLAEAEELGEVSFAKGHKEASGGSLTPELWEIFATKCLKLLKRDSAASKPSNSKIKAEAIAKKNGNTLDKYFLSPKKKAPS
ncbi:hypothetical protein ABW19_dt0208644 [Dactylella cylindrospora]|nr:hypothetical protein ABW19_dt0208644 [Dactylella cylindrospora]